MTWEEHIPPDIAELYEIHDYKHAAAILAIEFPMEFKELCEALRKFRLTVEDIKIAGGNESFIPKKFSEILRPMGWHDRVLTARLLADNREVSLDTHWVDYSKGRVAFDLEWNSKDQTFDRNLFAFRNFHEFGKISAGVILTRSEELNRVFASLGVKAKYGASTTWMGKLLPRLDAGRGGCCPILVFG